MLRPMLCSAVPNSAHFLADLREIRNVMSRENRAASCYNIHHRGTETRRRGSRKSEIGRTHFCRFWNRLQKSPISYLREQLVKRGKGAKFLYRLLRLPPLKILREFVSACLKGANNSPNASEHEFTQSLLRASESPW